MAVIKSTVKMDGRVIRSSQQCMVYARDEVYGKLDDDQEHAVGLYFNGALELIKHKVISSGHQDQTALDPKIVFRIALLCGASRVVIIHNHNSVRPPRPSDDDIESTKRMVECGELMCVEVADHIIISRGGWFSFRNNDKARRLWA